MGIPESNFYALENLFEPKKYAVFFSTDKNENSSAHSRKITVVHFEIHTQKTHTSTPTTLNLHQRKNIKPNTKKIVKNCF